MSQKLTEQELQDFQSFRQEANRLAAILGELHYQKTLLDLELENVKAGVKANAVAQQNLMKELGKKYGDGSINVETGEVTPLTS
jgi:K+/H+ antiporter YhaU regulatory subunit KhtT